jgi:hypothetical protein
MRDACVDLGDTNRAMPPRHTVEQGLDRGGRQSTMFLIVAPVFGTSGKRACRRWTRPRQVG